MVPGGVGRIIDLEKIKNQLRIQYDTRTKLNQKLARARSLGKLNEEDEFKAQALANLIEQKSRYTPDVDRAEVIENLNDFVAGAVAENRITILSDGTPWRPLIDVKDMARAIDWAARRDIANGSEFVAVNVGTDEWNYQVKDLAEAVAKTIPETKISISKDGQPDKRSYEVNLEIFRKIAPKYQPQSDLAS